MNYNDDCSVLHAVYYYDDGKFVFFDINKKMQAAQQREDREKKHREQQRADTQQRHRESQFQSAPSKMIVFHD
jgi:hypothetical protein